MPKPALKIVSPTSEKRKVVRKTPRRPKNADVRKREYLTEKEVERLIEGCKNNRQPHRDQTMILLASSARHRVDAIRELRACASGAEDTTKTDKERFVISINFGSHKLHKEIELKPVKPEQESLAIESKHEEENGEYGF